jgi:uncharacterized protein (DUF1501 family)
MLSRRDFLSRTVAGVSCVSFAGVMPRLFEVAADEAVVADKSDRVLVVVELAGGNDGLNTVVPFENDLYYKNRPTLGVPKGEVHRLSDQIGLHPNMASAAELFKSGKLAIVQGAGYPEPNRSHFRSMEIWHTASTSPKVPTTGWLGRLLDERFRPDDAETLRGLACTGSLPQAFLAEKSHVPVVQQLENFAAATGEGQTKEKLLKKLSAARRSEVGAPGSQTNTVDFLRRQSETVYRTAERLRDAAAKYKSGVMYPGELGQQLRRAAQVISADLGVRLFFCSHGGYDTHSNQAASHPALLSELSDALAAFQKDMEQLKVADRVMVMVFSEFGRRVDENGSRGTDHGAGSHMFLIGSKVKGGLAGSYPSLEKLGDGDLVHTVDFRSVYATILAKWLGCPAEKLLGERFPTLDLLNV